MKIYVKTRIRKNYIGIYHQFNLTLFKALRPPLMRLVVERFDGCELKDEIHLKVGPFSQRWISKITENIQSRTECTFVDEGFLVPAPITYWKHRHQILKIGEDASYIIDDIEYKCSNQFLSFVLYPLFYLQFLIRKPVYKNFFND